ncbi:hypothetical protein YC2023_114481 [Brassica napus]
MIGSYHERLDQTTYLGAVTLAKACWILDDGSMIWDDHLRRTGSLKGKLCKGSSVGSGKKCL